MEEASSELPPNLLNQRQGSVLTPARPTIGWTVRGSSAGGPRSRGFHAFPVHVSGLRAPFTRGDLEIHGLAGVQRPKAVHRDLGVVHKHVLLSIALDDPYPFSPENHFTFPVSRGMSPPSRFRLAGRPHALGHCPVTMVRRYKKSRVGTLARPARRPEISTAHMPHPPPMDRNLPAPPTAIKRSVTSGRRPALAGRPRPP